MSIVRTPTGHWVVAEDTGLGAAVRSCGTFEFDNNMRELVIMAPFIPDGGVVINAGACIGDHVDSYSRMVGPFGKVYAFEPHPESYQALVLNTARLRNVLPFPFALGETDGADVLSRTESAGSSFIGETDGNFYDAPGRLWPTAAVERTTLDRQLSWVHRLDLIHLDAEGMEVQILRGGRRLIEKFHPVLFVEVTDTWLARYGNTEQELLDLLVELGYEPLTNKPEKAQYNLLALPMKPVLSEVV